jgi:hypothetical protein
VHNLGFFSGSCSHMLCNTIQGNAPITANIKMLPYGSLIPWYLCEHVSHIIHMGQTRQLHPWPWDWNWSISEAKGRKIDESHARCSI